MPPVAPSEIAAPPRAVTIVGATASGKSGLAVAVAAELGGEVVNADALQIYRGLRIGTGKPTPEEQRAVPHHLFAELEPGERCSAGEYARRALRVVEEIASRGRLPVIVGGSGFYVRALLEGLDPMPAVPRQVRQEVATRLAAEGAESLWRELREIDPRTAAKLHVNDRQRIARALSVYRSSGRTLSSWQSQDPGPSRVTGPRLGLTLDRGVLYDRIGQRVERMLEAGWLEEVSRLMQEGVSTDSPAFQAIGYRQIAKHLECGGSFDHCVSEIMQATRRYAKRQQTWFRNQLENVVWFDAGQSERLTHRVLEHLEAAGFGRSHGET